MEIVEDGAHYFSSSKIVKMLEKLKKMSKKPQVDDNLGETLDSFMSHLNDKQQYLSNGIFNIRFAEAGLFLQSSVELYGKKVDLLFDTTLEYQKQLCSYRQDEEATKEIAKITERMRKRKQKAPLPVVESIYPNNVECIITNAKNADERLETNPEFYQAYLKQKLKEQTVRGELEISTVEDFFDLWQRQEDCDILDPHDEKTCSYTDLLCNISNLLFPITRRSHVDDRNKDVLEDHLVDKVRNLCLKNPVFVNVTRLPKDLIDAFENHNDGLVQTMVHRLLIESTTAVGGNRAIEMSHHDHDSNEDCGYISGPNSQFFNESQVCQLRMSNEDSGIGCTLNNDTAMDVDKTCPAGTTVNNTVPEENTGAETTVLDAQPQSFSDFFAPLMSSTPKKVPIVRLERISRKRMMQLTKEKPPRQIKRSRFKWLKTITVSENKFEKFHSQNYLASAGEGEVIPWMCDDSSSEGDDNNNFEIGIEHPIEPQFDATDFCKNFLTELLDKIDFTEPDPTDESTTQNQEIPSTSQQEQVVLAFKQRMQAIYHWKNFILPIINEAENRSKFDIHEYGTVLMDAIPEAETLLFKDLVTGLNCSEVSRFFVALLQLVNMYNIDLRNTCPGELATEKLEMRLLTRERYHKHLEDFEAPSENTFRDKLARIRKIQSESLNIPSTSSSDPDVVQSFIQNNSKQKKSRSKKQKLH